MVSDDSPFVAIRNCSFCGFSGDALNLPIKEKQHFSLGLLPNKSHLTIGQLSSIITTIDFWQAVWLDKTFYTFFFWSSILCRQEFYTKKYYLWFLPLNKHYFKHHTDETRMFTLWRWILKSHKYSLRSVDLSIRFTMDICQRLFN